MKESEKLYRTLFDNSEDGFILLEPIFDENSKASDFRFLKLNSAYERQTGAKAEDVLGKRTSEVTPELDPDVTLLSGDVVKTGKSAHHEAYDKYSSKWYDSYYFPYAEGQVGILFRDITERKKAEESLKDSEEKYRQLVDKLPDMVFEIDTNGRVVFANLRALEVLGYSKEELEQGFDANRLVAAKDVERSREDMKQAFAGGGIRRSFEYVFVRKDGTCLPVLLTSVPIIKDRQVVGVRGIAVDVTERKEMEKRFNEKERLAAIGATAGMVGHDLRNPLQSIIGEVYLAESELKSFPDNDQKESLQESIKAIGEQISYMDKIVSDLQTFVKQLKYTRNQ